MLVALQRTEIAEPTIAQRLSYKELAGCYQLTVSEWSRPLGGDKGFHSIPKSIRLDTTLTLRGGRSVTPDIVYPVGVRKMPGYPRWEIVRDIVRIAWSNGFTPTVLRLTKNGSDLSGSAEATSDAIPVGDPNWPRANVIATRVACPK
jgi:hypothetical protein